MYRAVHTLFGTKSFEVDSDKTQSYRQECAWRLAQWDDEDDERSDDGDSYAHHHAQALRALASTDRDLQRVHRHLSAARSAIKSELAGASIAAATTTALQRLEALGEVERMAEFASKEVSAQERALQKMLSCNEVRDATYGLQDRENTLLQRCIFLDTYSPSPDKNERSAPVPLVRALATARKEASVTYVRRCRDAGHHQAALRRLERLDGDAALSSLEKLR